MLKKTVKCRIEPMAGQAEILLATLNAFADTCNQILAVSHQTGKRRAYDLHHACYHRLKATTGLTANYVVRALARVAHSFGRKKPPVQFFPTSLDLDKDLFRYNAYDETVSLASVAGRLKKVKLRLGNFQRHLLKGQNPKAGTLSYDRKRKRFYINFVIEVSKPEPSGNEPLGCDLGINRILTTSDGQTFSGRKVNQKREQIQRTKSSLQAKGTKGAFRALKRLSGRQARYRRDVNHRLSKLIVAYALRHNYVIVLEDLTGIRERSNSKGKKLRKLMGGWAFYQLRQFILYKAAEAGVQVVFVQPAYTSKTCSVCFALGSRRKHSFVCVSCGYTADADVNAARCIAALGAPVNRPEVAALRQRQAARL